jgi:2-dehydropantoate 2-reductase
MKIAVMGAGAIGSYFGGRLAASGEEVHFIGRGSPHLQAMKQKGLKIISHHGDAYVPEINTTTDPKSVGPVDMILFCVKLWDLDTAAEQIKPMLKPGTAVYSFQNGIYAEGRLAELLGDEHVIGGYAATPTTVTEPGTVKQFGEWCTLGFGELDNRRTPRIEEFLRVCQRARIDSLIEPDTLAALWMKFIFITTHSGATSFCRSTEGPIRSDFWGRRMLQGLAQEGTSIARAKGINIAATNAYHVLEQIDELPPDGQGSMYTDLQRGNRLELEWLNGLMVKLGEEVGIPTPCHTAVMMALNLHAMGNGK